MKKYKIKNIKTPILDKCYCDKCKKSFEEDELQTIEFDIVDSETQYMNLVHADFCSNCLHELIKDHCRYNSDLGKDYDLDEHMKMLDDMKKGKYNDT
jgi:hypothetical protein